MHKYLVVALVIVTKFSTAQELFVFTEPASNMAAKSIGIRANNYLMGDLHSSKINFHILPELMWGVNKNLMIHAEAFISNRNNALITEGGSLYAKYRLYSIDEVHSHFRLAAYGRYSLNNSDIHQFAIDFFGHSSGYEGGLVATKLIKKVAVSGSGSFLHAQDNGKEKFLFGNKSRNAANYTLSVGKLMLPKVYTSYKQVNMNLMFEVLGQTNLNKGYSFLDIAPSVQFIFNSRMRFDLGYRYPVITKLHRTAPEGALIRLEYNFFNVY